jgi:hypothetical protein
MRWGLGLLVGVGRCAGDGWGNRKINNQCFFFKNWTKYRFLTRLVIFSFIISLHWFGCCFLLLVVRPVKRTIFVLLYNYTREAEKCMFVQWRTFDLYMYIWIIQNVHICTKMYIFVQKFLGNSITNGEILYGW